MSTAFTDALRAGGPVSLINADHASASVVDLLATLRVDAVLIDCEQGTPGLTDVADMARAAALGGVASLVRVPAPDPWIIERHLRRGVDGLVVPRLDTADQAARAVAAVRHACTEKAVIIQVESVGAVDELDGFLAVPGVDCFFVGPVDLATSMGFAGDYTRPQVVEAVDAVIARITAAGRRAGCLVTERDVAERVAQGVTMLYGHVNEFARIGARAWRALAGLEEQG